jgi:hypothetical protein
MLASHLGNTTTPFTRHSNNRKQTTKGYEVLGIMAEASPTTVDPQEWAPSEEELPCNNCPQVTGYLTRDTNSRQSKKELTMSGCKKRSAPSSPCHSPARRPRQSRDSVVETKGKEEASNWEPFQLNGSENTHPSHENHQHRHKHKHSHKEYEQQSVDNTHNSKDHQHVRVHRCIIIAAIVIIQDGYLCSFSFLVWH